MILEIYTKQIRDFCHSFNMKGIYSYNWLNSFFDKSFPGIDKLSDSLNLHSFEVEEFEKKDNDYLICLDILPPRAPVCLSHVGLAKEISTIFNIPLNKKYFENKFDFSKYEESAEVKISTDGCDKYVLLHIDCSEIKDTPEFIQKRLASIDQKLINPIVDISNYILFEIGQPNHAFDKSVVGGIEVKNASGGETFVTLSDEEVKLSKDDILIIDSKNGKVLGLGGVKGGKFSMVESGTNEILLEVATFDSSRIRNTSRLTGLTTDASIRYSADLPLELIDYSLFYIESLFEELGGKVLGATKVEKRAPEEKAEVVLTLQDLEKKIGIKYSRDTVVEILNKLGFNYEVNGDEFKVMQSNERFDVNILEDLIEEIVRVDGYNNVPSNTPKKLMTPKILKSLGYRFKITNALTSIGFSEVITYTFREKGKLCVLYPIAEDRCFLREDLSVGLKEAGKLNSHNGELLGLGEVRIFEFGNVFNKLEEIKLGMHVKYVEGRSKKIDYKAIEDKIKEVLKIEGIELPGGFEDGVWEINFSELLKELKDLDEYKFLSVLKDVNYVKPSKYPFVLRDISVFLNSRNEEGELIKLIHSNSGSLLKRINPFDIYEKDGKVSFAFRLVFQSETKTLNDEAIGEIMSGLENKIKEVGWEVR